MSDDSYLNEIKALVEELNARGYKFGIGLAGDGLPCLTYLEEDFDKMMKYRAEVGDLKHVISPHDLVAKTIQEPPSDNNGLSIFPEIFFN